jgi:S1-C subfamily serine protease
MGALVMRGYVTLNFFILLMFSVTNLFAQQGGIENLKQTGKAFASVAKQVSPAVVFVQAETIRETEDLNHYPSPFDDDVFRRFFGDRFLSCQTTDAQKRNVSEVKVRVFSFRLTRGSSLIRPMY